MDLRTGSSAVERGTRPRPLRGAILARPSPSCTHDNDRLRLPSATSPQKSAAGKKESTDRRRNQACQPCVTPSSRSSLDCYRNAARTAKGGSAQIRGVNESAKVVLVGIRWEWRNQGCSKSGVLEIRRAMVLWSQIQGNPVIIQM